MADVRPPAPEPGEKFKKNGKTYVVCPAGACSNEIEGKKIRCRTESCKKPCNCMLLIATDEDRQWVPDPHEPDDDGWYPYDPDIWVYCACVRLEIEP